MYKQASKQANRRKLEPKIRDLINNNVANEPRQIIMINNLPLEVRNSKLFLNEVKNFSIHPKKIENVTHFIQMGWNFLWLLTLMPKAYFQSFKILGQEV
jgi:hypothetical protein